MESFAWPYISQSGINMIHNQGIRPMNKAKNLLLAGTLAIAPLFAAQAQNDSLAYADTKPKTELETKGASVREGGFGAAERHAYRNEQMVIMVYGTKGIEGQPDESTAVEDAEALVKAAKNSQYTTDIVVYYTELDRYGTSVAGVLMGYSENGKKQLEEFTMTNKKTGQEVDSFRPKTIEKNIDYFTKAYWSRKGLSASVHNSQSYTLNND